MSVVSVEARSFILALFIRDDGERFLLGDNGYDFIDSQLHFTANAIENDEVQKQGTDGVLVAGQVRRASVQTFDGYIGDATIPKAKIEQMRRDFFAFFAKGHHFRVIYVDCNRDAWQRKGGYLVDAPEVKELWQIHPEYHVGLNFEDVNYYEYDENAEGEEILANVLSVPISSEIEGGLEWDENGAISVLPYGDSKTATGKTISISDAVNAPLASFQLDGETSQTGTPTPDVPVPVQTVTGENVVKICGKNLFDKNSISTGYLNADGTLSSDQAYKTSDFIAVKPNTAYYKTYTASPRTKYFDSARQPLNTTTYQDIPIGGAAGTFTTPANAAYVRFSFPVAGINLDTTQLELGSTATAYEPYQGQSYPISLGSIELCKIGTYQDYIYKSGDKWYKHAEIGKTDLANYNYTVASAVLRRTTAIPNMKYVSANTEVGSAIAEKYIIHEGRGMSSADLAGYMAVDVSMFAVNVGTSDTSVNPTGLLYYALATPTDTEITNEALIEQLDAILSQGSTYAGTTNITTVIATGNEQGTLEVGYYSGYQDGGYVWEEGGSGGPTTVVNESISAVYPVWTVYGPAQNPILENTTNNTSIEYVGMVADGQTLVIDMGAQTASLDGLNVLSALTGDFIQLEAGNNILLYSASNDAPASEIGWSEIVG